MKRLAFVFIVLLVGCDTQPTMHAPTTAPEMAGIIAGATQTSVYATTEARETARYATVQSAYVQQTKASYNATSTSQAVIAATATTQAQQTAVIATETAVYVPISLQQTQDAQAVLMARQSVDSTATAVYTIRQIEQDAAKAVRNDKWWTMFQNFVAGIMVVIVAFGVVAVYRKLNPHMPLFNDHGEVVAFDASALSPMPRQRALPRPAVMLTDPDPQPTIDATPPINNQRPARWNKPNGETEFVDVDSNSEGISPLKWYSFAFAVLVDGKPPTRRGLEDTHLTQSDFTYIYDFLCSEQMVSNGVGGKMVFDKTEGYEFLFNKLNLADRQKVTLPHPDSLTLVEDTPQPTNQPTNHR